jgi:hypothetical protein
VRCSQIVRRTGPPVTTGSSGQEDAEEEGGQGAEPGERAQDRAAPRRPGADVQGGGDAGDQHDHELDDQRGAVAAVVADLRGSGGDVPDSGRDEYQLTASIPLSSRCRSLCGGSGSGRYYGSGNGPGDGVAWW